MVLEKKVVSLIVVDVDKVEDYVSNLPRKMGASNFLRKKKLKKETVQNWIYQMKLERDLGN